MIRSVIAAQVGRAVVKLRYDLSHMISMASFLAGISNRLRPPSLRGRQRKSRVILGDESSPHMKFWIILVKADLMGGGIPGLWQEIGFGCQLLIGQ